MCCKNSPWLGKTHGARNTDVLDKRENRAASVPKLRKSEIVTSDKGQNNLSAKARSAKAAMIQKMHGPPKANPGSSAISDSQGSGQLPSGKALTEEMLFEDSFGMCSVELETEVDSQDGPDVGSTVLGEFMGLTSEMPTQPISVKTDVNAIGIVADMSHKLALTLPTVRPDGALKKSTSGNSMNLPEYSSQYEGRMLLVSCPNDFNMGSTVVPDWEMHFSRGSEVYFVRWELNFPNEASVLDCLTCDCATCQGLP